MGTVGAKVEDKKCCTVCGGMYPRKMYVYEGKKHIEDLKIWKGRQFCSVLCANRRPRSKREFKPKKYQSFDYGAMEAVLLPIGFRS